MQCGDYVVTDKLGGSCDSMLVPSLNQAIKDAGIYIDGNIIAANYKIQLRPVPSSPWQDESESFLFFPFILYDKGCRNTHDLHNFLFQGLSLLRLSQFITHHQKHRTI